MSIMTTEGALSIDMRVDQLNVLECFNFNLQKNSSVASFYLDTARLTAHGLLVMFVSLHWLGYVIITPR